MARARQPRGTGNQSLLVAALVVAIMAFATLVTPTRAQAQFWPEKAIKLVVPFGPGGPTDVAARIVSQILQPALGQSIVIENRPGAGGATGSRAVATADPDGYTLLLGTAATHGAVPALAKNAGFDPVKSFTAVAKVTDSTTVMISPATFAPGTLATFIAYAKANPGKLNYASAGVGNLTQLNAELFKARAGIDVVHVPFKSGSEMVTAILAEQTHMAFVDISILLPLIEAKKIKALAVTRGQRHPTLPDVPTMAENGWADFVTTFWTGVFAPPATPPAIVERLSAAIGAGLATSGVRDTLAKVGAEPAALTSQAFAAFVAAEAAKWAGIVKLSGIAPE